MKIKLNKSWRYAGQIIKAGTILEINDENTLNFLKENKYVQEKEKKEKKSKIKIAEENN
tara:strand:+ start:3058 stop:3234 length:177 start_codon:yes stop_codon:yes gene_type:complete